MSDITVQQRFTRDRPCPICGGNGRDHPHCHGFSSTDGEWAYCTRADGSDGALLNEKCEPPAFTFRRKPDGGYRPWTKEPPAQAVRGARMPMQVATPSGHDGKAHPLPIGTRYFHYADGQRVARTDYAHRDKEIRPQHRAADGAWKNGDGPGEIRRVYRRIDADAHPNEPLYLVEGEGVADVLNGLGLLAITWRGGCGQVSKALPQLAEVGRNRDLLLLPDDDTEGRKAMVKIAAALTPVARSVKVVALYIDGETKRDVEDWLAAGGTVDRLVALANATPEYAATGEPLAHTDADIWEPKITLLSDVEPERVRWLWCGYIPLGKLTVLDGDPGNGKSTLMCDHAARVTTGRAMPDGSASDLDGPAGVVLLSAEDGPADTIRPRLDAAGADVSRVALLECAMSGERERSITLADVEHIDAAIRRVDARLVIIDPLMAYLDGRTNSYRDQDMPGILAPLARLADRTGAAIVVIRHFSKGQTPNVLYRGGGSIGIIGAARVGLVVAPDPEEPDGPRRVLAVAKSNLAMKPPAMAYRLAPATNGTAYIAWEGATRYAAADLMAQPTDSEERSALDEAKDFLRQILADGPLNAEAVIAASKKVQVAERTLKRAKRALGAESRREGFGDGAYWVWALPPEPDGGESPRSVPKDAEGCQSNSMAPFDLNGTLRTDSEEDIDICRTWLTGGRFAMTTRQIAAARRLLDLGDGQFGDMGVWRRRLATICGVTLTERGDAA